MPNTEEQVIEQELQLLAEQVTEQEQEQITEQEQATEQETSINYEDRVADGLIDYGTVTSEDP